MINQEFIRSAAINLLMIFLAGTVAAQTDAANGKILPPASSDLVTVELPDLSGVEKEVRKQIEEFQTSLQRAVATKETDPESLAESYGTMGQIFHAYSFITAAEQCYINAAKLAPRNVRWVYLRGKLFEERNAFGDAVAFYQKTLAIEPKYVPAMINLGNAFLQLNSLTAAKESFENALALSKDEPAALFGLGQTAYAEKDLENAARYFEKVLQIVPAANRVHYSLALVYRDLKNSEKAKFHLENQGVVGVRAADPVYDALNELKKGVRLRLIRAKMALEAGRFQDAEAELQIALASEPENVSALINYGFAMVQAKRLPEAAVYFEKAISLEPGNTNALYNLAVVYSLQKKHFRALEYLKRIIAINPKDTNARFLLAKELRDADLLIESQNEFLIVYNANPDNETVLLEAVKLLVKKGDGAIAKNLLEKAHTKFPDRKTTSAALAYFLAAAPQKDLREGAKALEIARALYEKEKTAVNNWILTLSYAETGNCAEAAKLANGVIQTLDNSGDKRAAEIFPASIKSSDDKNTCRPE